MLRSSLKSLGMAITSGVSQGSLPWLCLMLFSITRTAATGKQNASASPAEGGAPVLPIPSVVGDIEVHVIEEVVGIALLVLWLPSHREGED
ncbi:hypothetical protein E2C01_034183 [Portunus trituberculatus]|uniref:Uncharacterized protein n=1 Tax=Portunus trituberculatus TaxID=210409 RepID=A0A5B7EZW5_PORTR|nr:hypothetical protein [Portunus trituberculatus]